MTESELLAEIEALLANHDEPADARTTSEWAEFMGMGEAAARRRLKVAQNAGRLEIVKVRRTRFDGVAFSTTAYRILAQPHN